MKREHDNRTGVQERTSMKDKSGNRNARHSGRPNPSQNTINPNRGLNEDEQKQATNQEEDEATNAYAETNKNESSEGKDSNEGKDSKRSTSSEKHEQKR